MLSGKLCICLHDISSSNYVYSFDKDRLESMVRFLLAREYRFVKAQDYYSIEPSENVACLTFDDGLRSLENVVGIIEKFRIPSTFFICTEFLATGYSSFLSKKHINEYSRHELLEIGGHGSSHIDLQVLHKDDIEFEVMRCKEKLFDILGYNPRCFAYPFGSFNDQVAMIVESHFDFAFSVFGTRGGRDKYSIPRFDLNNSFKIFDLKSLYLLNKYRNIRFI